MKERYYYLDVIRVLACLMVILMHSPMPADQCTATDSYLLAPLTYFTAPCIGLFFMVSGALLLNAKTDNNIGVLKRRLGKILAPILVWTLFYVGIHCLSASSEELPAYLIKSLTGMFFSAQGHGILWFLYTLAGIYLLVPILSPWWHNASKREIELYLGIWLLTTCYPYLRYIWDIPANETNMFYYFGGYGGYFMLGGYLHKYGKQVNKLTVVCGCVLFSLLPPLIAMRMNGNVDFSLFWNLSISVVMMCICWFIAIQRVSYPTLSNRLMAWISDISSMSFGIYLIHIFIMRCFLWKMPFVHPLPYIAQIPVVAVLTFVLSYWAVKMISKTAWSKYIIGC